MNAPSPSAKQTTRAVVTESDGACQLRPIDLDVPGPGELVVDLEACGLCGTDLVKMERRRAQAGQHSEPVVLGHELVGRIAQTGAEAPWRVGQRVVIAHHVPCGHCRLCRNGAETSCPAYQENLLVPGGFSERVLIRERAARHSTFAFDDEQDVRDLVFLEPLACVLRSIERGRVAADARALILGAGSMGLLHLLALRATLPGVSSTLVDRDATRLATAERLGAGSTRADVESSNDESFDVVFDTIGDSQLLDRALELARPGTVAVLFAHAAPSEPLQLDFHRVFRNELTVTSSYSSGRADQIRAYELLAGRHIQPAPIVTHRLPLTQFDEAVDQVRHREALKAILVADTNP